MLNSVPRFFGFIWWNTGRSVAAVIAVGVTVAVVAIIITVSAIVVAVGDGHRSGRDGHRSGLCDHRYDLCRRRSGRACRLCQSSRAGRCDRLVCRCSDLSGRRSRCGDRSSSRCGRSSSHCGRQADRVCLRFSSDALPRSSRVLHGRPLCLQGSLSVNSPPSGVLQTQRNKA